MLNRTVVFISRVLAIMILSLPVIAHEYWLQPVNFILQQDKFIEAHIQVGQDFKGDKFPYIDKDVASMQIHLGGDSKIISSRTGDYPAIAESALGDGLNILTIASNPYTLTYKKPGKFEKFVQHEGIDWVLAEHAKRSLPEIGFTETFLRDAKTLVKVGSGKGEDRKTGLEFEWVLHTNPYITKKEELFAQLFWQGKVFANRQYRTFIRTDDELIIHVSNTDEHGMASIPRQPKATYLLNAVHMVLPDKATAEKYNAVWESRWASLTFATE